MARCRTPDHIPSISSEAASGLKTGKKSFIGPPRARAKTKPG